MAKFSDNADREWSVVVTTQTVLDLKREADFNIRKLLNSSDELQKIYDDPFLIIDVIDVCCKKQRVERGVDINDFFGSLGGPELDAATKAFIEALVDFFQPRQRVLLAAMLAKIDETYQGMTDKMQTSIATLDVSTMVDREAQKATEAMQQALT